MASRYGKNPIKDKKETGYAGEKEKAANKQRLRGKAKHSSTSTVQSRTEKTNARGGNKPISKDTLVKSTKGQMKRVLKAREKDMADEKATAKSAKTVAKKVAKGAAKVAAKAATRAVPVVGQMMLAKDAYGAVKDNQRPAKEKKAEAKRRESAKKKAATTRSAGKKKK